MTPFSKEDLIAKGQETGWDARKIVLTLTAVALICGIAWWVIPILLSIAWGIVQLGIAAFVIFLMAFVGKWLFKWMWAINAFVAKYTLGLICEWDEFIIQEQQIDKAEQDVEKMLEEKKKIEGKFVELSQKVKANKIEFEENTYMAQEAKAKGDMDVAEDSTLAAGRNQAYIETIEPIVTDMQFIINFTQEMHKVLKRKIKNAKADLVASKDLFYSAQSGASMLASAEKAMNGDRELNNNAAFSKERVKEKIALSIGQMRASMSVLTEVSTEQNYRDHAKIQLAMNRLKEINSSDTGEDKVSTTFQGIEQPKPLKDLL